MRSFFLVAALTASSEGAVQRMSPSSGSLCGGTRLSIYGSGFANKTSANRVEIGGDECKIESVSADMLVCQVPFQNSRVVTGKESATKSVSVYANGAALAMSQPLEFKFEADMAPIIADWGPTTGQANDVVSFEGKSPLFGTSVELNGRECKVKHSEGIYYQCVPPPGEAGVSNVEVYFGPDNGFACPGPKAAPLKFTYNLALQSALASDLVDDTEGPFDGGGLLTAGPCSPRTPRSGTLTVVGQGLGASTTFKLCGDDAWCEREGEVTEDPELYHSGDWSFQTVTCRPSPLDPSKAPGGSRKCDLTAVAADGMFVATLPDAWTYMATTLPVTSTAQPAAAAALPGAGPTETEVYWGGAAPGPGPGAIPWEGNSPAAPPSAAGPAQPGPAPPPAPAPVPQVPPPPPVAVPTPKPVGKEKKVLQRMAKRVLADAFESLGNMLDKAAKPEAQTLLEGNEQEAPQIPPPYQVPVEAPKPQPLKVPEAPEPPVGLQPPAPAAAPPPLLQRGKAGQHRRHHRARPVRHMEVMPPTPLVRVSDQLSVDMDLPPIPALV